MERVIYKKSLEAKLTLTRGFSLDVYQSLMDASNTHSGVKTRLSFEKTRISYKDKNIAIVKAFRKNVVVYFALDPAKVAKKYKVVDASEYEMYKEFPSKLIIAKEKDLDLALQLLEKMFKTAKATELCQAQDVNYSEVFYERTFGELYKAGLIKKYVKNYAEPKAEAKPVKEVVKEAPKPVVAEEEEDDDEDLVEVTFTAKLIDYEGELPELYVVTNFSGWNVNKPLKMDRDGYTYSLLEFFPRGYELEFKITKGTDWMNVEKGIFGEEIVNHSYKLDQNMEVEDLIHNFRIA